jgi:hypothetical protein
MAVTTVFAVPFMTAPLLGAVAHVNRVTLMLEIIPVPLTRKYVSTVLDVENDSIVAQKSMQ